MNKDKIVADGQQRIQKTEEYQRKASEIRTSIKEKYRTEIAQSSFFKRVILSLKMQREIRREIQELAPDRALYLTRATHSSEGPTEGKSKHEKGSAL